jgi:hypothetical protein
VELEGRVKYVHIVTIVKLLLSNAWITQSFGSYNLSKKKVALKWCC